MCTKIITKDNGRGTGSRYGLTSESNTFLFLIRVKSKLRAYSGPVYHRSFFPFSPAPNSKYVRARTSILTTLCPAIFLKPPDSFKSSMFFMI
ncbi:hypothetical protein N7455_010754 [Penicillium solitum]|uniref:uncharacterized protein n=1 Tax=Penicillium solitum TaxID=60172 RepID=UPI0032C474D2|nr:hypothetical protein N7455_010754 [Penicillium solitum]